MQERVFVVGAGTTTCVGKDLESTWQNLIAGRSGIRRHPSLDGESFLQDIAGMVDGLEGDTIWADRYGVKSWEHGFCFAGVESRERRVGRCWFEYDHELARSPPGRRGRGIRRWGGIDFLEAQQYANAKTA